jgi:hypothetical protein
MSRARQIVENETPKSVMHQFSPGSRFIMQPLSWQEIEVLADVLAMGPLTRQPWHEKFLKLGYLTLYDDMPDAVEAAEGFGQAFYDKNGFIRKGWLSER